MSEHERKIRKAIEMERHRQLGAALHRGVKSALKKFLAGTAIIGAAVICAGFYDGDQERVEITYVVQLGDTLWHIGEEHIKLNTGGRRYLPEFVEGIKELNPWVKENDYVIHAGDKIRISYWVKKASD